jgi:tetratricopeptide (TPR) repeat protein
VVRTTNDPQTALTDFEEALRQNPRSLPALENKAHILGEKLGRTTEAVEVLTRAITLYPEHAPARASLGTLRARLGRRGLALEEARAALALDASPQTLFQVAGIWALTSRQVPDDRRQAVALLSAALRQGYGHDLLRTDTDLDPIRDDPLFRPLLQAVNVFEQAPRIEGTGARKPERSAP